MSTTTVKGRQSILDIAIQETGSIESAFTLASLNELSLTDNLTVGKTLTLTDVVSKNIVNTYTVNSYVPATSFSNDDIQVDGINFMGIEIDFIVS